MEQRRQGVRPRRRSSEWPRPRDIRARAQSADSPRSRIQRPLYVGPTTAHRCRDRCWRSSDAPGRTRRVPPYGAGASTVAAGAGALSVAKGGGSITPGARARVAAKQRVGPICSSAAAPHEAPKCRAVLAVVAAPVRMGQPRKVLYGLFGTGAGAAPSRWDCSGQLHVMRAACRFRARAAAQCAVFLAGGVVFARKGL